MKSETKSRFLERWNRYFGSADLPVAYFYTDEVDGILSGEGADGERCLIGHVDRVREDGCDYVYDLRTPGCPGGKRYSGFVNQLRPGFEYFLSCGIPGKLEGERYKKTPELVSAFLEGHPFVEAPGRYLVFKRWDHLAERDEPLAVIFFATPDVLAGLFTLANYDLASEQGVVAPMGAGCATILQYPLLEATAEVPRCVLGMFDVSARPCVPAGTLTFTVPIRRLHQMVDNMDESFLITESWKHVLDRIQSAGRTPPR